MALAVWLKNPQSRAVLAKSSFKDFMVTPSQGSHFFQNLTSFMIGYFTVNDFKNLGFIDWEWLAEQKPHKSLTFSRHLRFKKQLCIKMNGQQNKGIILKPEI